MGFRFRKSISVIPGVRINLGGRRGPSLTVGPRGASVNVGPRGTYVNAGVPGTGMSYRERLDGAAPDDNGAHTAPAAVDTAAPAVRGRVPWLLVFVLGVIAGALVFGR